MIPLDDAFKKWKRLAAVVDGLTKAVPEPSPTHIIIDDISIIIPISPRKPHGTE